MNDIADVAAGTAAGAGVEAVGGAVPKVNGAAGAAADGAVVAAPLPNVNGAETGAVAGAVVDVDPVLLLTEEAGKANGCSAWGFPPNAMPNVIS